MGDVFQAAKVTGTAQGTSRLAFSWDDATTILNVLRVGGPTLTCFLEKGEGRKMGKGNQVKYAKMLEEEMCVCAYVRMCMCVSGQPSQGDMLWPERT